MKTSIGLRAHFLLSTAGKGGRVAGLKLHQSDLSGGTCASGGGLSICAARAAKAPAAHRSGKSAAFLRMRGHVCVSLTIDPGSVGLSLNKNTGVGQNISGVFDLI